MKMYEQYLYFSKNNDTIITNLLIYEMMFYCSISGGCLDIYDVNSKIFQNPTSPLGDLLQDWFNLSDVMKAFNTDHPYKVQSLMPYFALLKDFNLSERLLVKNLLNFGLPMLLYYGHDDIICNYVGSNNWISKINWVGQEEFDNSTLKDWYINGNIVAQYKYSSGLSYCLIYNSGHMVPYYQPEISFIMFDSFLKNYKIV